MASQATLDRLCAEFDSPAEHIAKAVALLEQNATPVYLARYRRHELGNMSEDRLVAVAERLHHLSELEQRRATILQQADERGRRTPELERALAETADQDLLDDYYQSMRPRRRGLAMQMEEKGLLPLALAIQHRQFGDAAIETVPAKTAAEPSESTPSTGAEQSDAGQPDAEQSDAEQSEGGQSEAGQPAVAPTTDDTGTGDTASDVPASDVPGADVQGSDSLPQGVQATDEPPADSPESAKSGATSDAAVADVDLRKLAEPYVSEENGIPTPENALEGALLILADRIVHDPLTRARFRDALRRGILRAKPVNPDGDPGKYKKFFDFAEPINRIPSGRMLALRRAEREKILQLELVLPPGKSRELLRKLHAPDTTPGTQLGDFYDLVFDHAAASLQELCGNDVRRRLKEKADREAMRTYARNLRSQLLAPPLGAKKVLALRTSGKAIWAVLLNEDGSVAQHKTLPTDNDEQKEGAIGLLAEMVREHEPHAIAIPHGRRQASSEKVVAQVRSALGDTPMPMVVPVDEAASTIFATSTGGKKAIPGVEVGVRTAISLGRRLQDPLLELLRMDIRTLGLGQTLDDVHQGTLQRELGRVKSSCLAEVGCDLNTAGADVLQSVPGLGSERAQALVKHRKQIGGFKNRAQLREVDSINEACYRNIAGFVHITGGDEPLDATPIHPDDYELVRAIAQQKGVQPIELIGRNLRDVDVDALVSDDWPKERILAVLKQLHHAGKDHRGVLMATANEGVQSLADLHQDRELKGRIASLTEFGAFVDLGIGQDGLVHISQIPNHRLRDPNQMLRVGEVVTVWVLNVDQQKNKISLSMHKPRHLAEGRLPTLGERMEQQQGRRSGRGRGRGHGERGPRDSQEGRRPGAGRPGGGGNRRGAPGRGRDGEREGTGGGRFGGGRFGGGGRGPRGGGPREQRVYTVEPAREVAEQRTKKGELTSLSNLRNLLNRSSDEQADKEGDK